MPALNLVMALSHFSSNSLGLGYCRLVDHRAGALGLLLYFSKSIRASLKYANPFTPESQHLCDACTLACSDGARAIKSAAILSKAGQILLAHRLRSLMDFPLALKSLFRSLTLCSASSKHS